MLLKVVAVVEVDGRVWKLQRSRVVGVGEDLGGGRKVNEESEEKWGSDIVRVLSMGTRTMGSHGAGGGNGGIQHPKSDGLSKQGALYNLTLDEVQHQLGDLGKPLSSMNLDELLKNVWTAEGESNQAPGPLDLHHHTQLASTSSMARQSSLADLSKKTVDELWQDIQKKKDTTTTHTSSGNDNNGGSGGGYNLERKSTQEKQQTLGEMTLEDFLAKAGIVAEEKKKKNSGSVIVPESIQNIVPQQAQWMQYQTPAIPQQQQQQQQQHVFMTGHHQAQQSLPMEAAYPDTHMTVSPLMGTLSDTQTPGRKRVASGDVIEKTVERRQKRMIKNRESAARSRARKQAYTHELENKVSRLEEENERLKREQEAENVLACVPPPEPNKNKFGDIQTQPNKMQYKAAKIGKGIEAKIAPNFPVEKIKEKKNQMELIMVKLTREDGRLVIPKTEKKIMKAADI
ncbi:hypothetical protein LXL04_000157 [Taraxacum kok-saghyz]